MDVKTALILLLIGCACWGGYANTGLRLLLQNPQNQELIRHLGTRFEVVHPVQIGQDHGRGLSTRTQDGTISHLQHTALLIEAYEYKLHLSLELSTNLFPSTFVHLIYVKDGPPEIRKKFPENCYYQATVKDNPEALAAFSTCNGIRGVIVLQDKVLLLYPLFGDNSGNHPHLLFHLNPDKQLKCGNSDSLTETSKKIALSFLNEEVIRRMKYVEVAIIIDRELFLQYESSHETVVTNSLQILNYANMFLRPLNTSMSAVFLEVWAKNKTQFQTINLSKSLEQFAEYSKRRFKKISVDAAFLFSGQIFNPQENGMAISDSICTSDAVGIILMEDVYQPHLTSHFIVHLLGHVIGMQHPTKASECSKDSNCLMENRQPFMSSYQFSNCSLNAYHDTLMDGYGSCLFNMPTMRTSVCGNSILEGSEECDCGSPEECVQHNPCCDPVTCKLVPYAECSSGSCCKKCKLLSSDYLCRSSKGECDVPEFCDGQQQECPDDIFKRNGAICEGGLGYCYQGECPSFKSQCQQIWGEDADSANSACYERLNVLGTPNGNCGFDNKGDLRKCSLDDSFCGTLQCEAGEKAPMDRYSLPMDFVIYKMNAHGLVHECKARTFSSSQLLHGLVRDGTKCGYQKVCVNQTCTSIKSGKCPQEERQSACSGHGVCTSVQSCFCHVGWKGTDCSEVDNTEPVIQNGEDGYFGGKDLRVDPNLAITVLAASIFVGLGLVILAVVFIFYRNTRTAKDFSCHEEKKLRLETSIVCD